MESNKLNQPYGGEDPPLNYPANSHMKHFIISAEDGHWLLSLLNTNKSEGADEIHPKIITSLVSFLATPLANLYNNSIATDKIPVEWRKGCKNNVANYRPICLTPVA